MKNNPIKDKKTIIHLFSKHLNREVDVCYYNDKDEKKIYHWCSSWGLFKNYSPSDSSYPSTITHMSIQFKNNNPSKKKIYFNE